jgi:hypothetical protein
VSSLLSYSLLLLVVLLLVLALVNSVSAYILLLGFLLAFLVFPFQTPEVSWLYLPAFSLFLFLLVFWRSSSSSSSFSSSSSSSSSYTHHVIHQCCGKGILPSQIFSFSAFLLLRSSVMIRNILNSSPVSCCMFA